MQQQQQQAHKNRTEQMRKEKALAKLRATVTVAELARIKEQREFDAIEKGTWTHKIALHLDALRRNLRVHFATIEKRLWNIENIKNSQARLQAQIDTDNIHEEVADGITMTKNEVMNKIKHDGWLKLGEVQAVAPELARIRSIVGHKDLTLHEIMTEEQFDKYVKKIEDRLQTLGYSILS